MVKFAVLRDIFTRRARCILVSPEGIKIQETSKNIPRYYTPNKRFIIQHGFFLIMNFLVTCAWEDQDKYKYNGIFVLVSRVICTRLS